jgi:hypothetical protein
MVGMPKSDGFCLGEASRGTMAERDHTRMCDGERGSDYSHSIARDSVVSDGKHAGKILSY